MTLATPPVTVIVPCFNEEAGLGPLLARLQDMRRGPVADWRFLFVDDGSTDHTFARLLEAARDHSWVQVVRHHENLGLGAALRTGFAQTLSPVVCAIDSDCTYPPEMLPPLATLVQSGDADIATASAWHPESVTAEGSWIRIKLSRLVSSIYKLLIGQDVYTFTCLFRAYRREPLARIRFRSNGFAAVAEIMLRAMLAGYRVGELPMGLERRRYGESKLKVGDAIVAHMRLLTMTALITGMQNVRHLTTRLLPLDRT